VTLTHTGAGLLLSIPPAASVSSTFPASSKVTICIPRREGKVSDLMGNALALRRLLRAPGAYVALCSAALGGLLALAWDLAGTPGGNGLCCNLGQQVFLAAYLGRTDAEAATRVRTYAAIHRFRHAYSAPPASTGLCPVRGRCSRCGARPRARPNVTAADLDRSMFSTTRNARMGDRRRTVSLPSGLPRTAL